jgi:hypothetical protein
MTTRKSECWKCNGTGKLTWTSLANGLCFACQGSGELDAGYTLNPRPGMFEFKLEDGPVWQFETIHHAEDCHYRVDPNGSESVDSILFQAITGNGKRGTTVLRARVSPAVGRMVWRAAKSGRAPDFTAEELGVTEPSCAITRNRKGISYL